MKKHCRYSAISFSLLCTLILLIGCASAVKDPIAIDSALVMTPDNPAPEYRIQSGDQLDIKFYYNPDLNEQVTVRPDGRISLQLAKEITAAGMTPAKLDEFLTAIYAEELEAPEIAVIVRSFTAQRVYVDGEVNRPGLVSLVPPMSVVQTLSQAGGLKDTARLSEVVIIRRGADSKPVHLVINLEKIMDGTDKIHDIVLQPSDIVFIPKSHIANINQWIDLYLRRNIPVPFGFGISLN